VLWFCKTFFVYFLRIVEDILALAFLHIHLIESTSNKRRVNILQLMAEAFQKLLSERDLKMNDILT